MSDLLTDADLEELTGYVQPDAQVKCLRAYGLAPVIRKDGRPRVTWAAVSRAMLGRAHNDSEPDFDALRRTG